MKKWIALIAMLLAVLTLSGCNLIGFDAELDGAQVVAKVNDTELTKADWAAYRDYLIQYDQYYMMQYLGYTMDVDDEMMASYNEGALDGIVQSEVVRQKLVELGYEPLPEDKAAEVTAFADDYMALYEMMIRYQNYADVETVEEEEARLAAEAAEATPAEPVERVATITDAQLMEMIHAEMAEMGYTREYFESSQKNAIQSDLLYAHATADVTITDEQVQNEYDAKVAEQKAKYDANATQYALDNSNGVDVYYVPAGYRGVKNILVAIPETTQSEIDTLNSTLSTAQATLTNVNGQIADLEATDTAEYTEEQKAEYDAQLAALREQAETANATITDVTATVTAMTETAQAELKVTAEDVLAQLQAGGDFDALMATYGSDPGMKSGEYATTGYPICEGLGLYVQEFQDAAMALENVGDISGLVETSYGYHILQYTMDLTAGAVEMNDTVKETLRSEMLTEAQDAAYEAKVLEWVEAADVKTYPKVIK